MPFIESFLTHKKNPTMIFVNQKDIPEQLRIKTQKEPHQISILSIFLKLNCQSSSLLQFKELTGKDLAVKCRDLSENGKEIQVEKMKTDNFKSR